MGEANSSTGSGTRRVDAARDVVVELTKAIPLAVGCLTIIGGLIGGASWIDARYAHRAELTQVAQDDEQGRLENQLALYRLQLAALRAQSVRTPDDELQIRFLEDAILTIQKRLAGLVSKG